MSGLAQAPRVLQLGLLWPEEHGSAAGVRTAGITRALASMGWDVTVAAASSLKAVSAGSQVHTMPDVALDAVSSSAAVPGRTRRARIRPNDSPGMTALLDAVRPDLVVFDRFMSEEMFSHQVRAWGTGSVTKPSGFSECKPALVLDMQDFHSLRQARQEVCERSASQGSPWESAVKASLEAVPDASSVTLQRELASMARVDAVWAVSETEQLAVSAALGTSAAAPTALASPLTALLVGPVVSTVGFPSASGGPLGGAPSADASARKDAVMLGTFRHDPNADAVSWAIDEIWPKCLSLLHQRTASERPTTQPRPQPRLHIYGSHLSESAAQRLRGAIGRAGLKGSVLLHGHMDSLNQLLEHRVLLAPLRFGAGVKGKVLDAWRFGLPVVTTPIGSEGLDAVDGAWGGCGDAMTADTLAKATCQLLLDDALWQGASQRGTALLGHFASDSRFRQGMHPALELALDSDLLSRHRRRNNLQAMAWHASLRSTQFMSQYIEAKEALRAAVQD
jgi:hypothetical protein